MGLVCFKDLDSGGWLLLRELQLDRYLEHVGLSSEMLFDTIVLSDTVVSSINK